MRGDAVHVEELESAEAKGEGDGFGEALIGFGHTQSNYKIDQNATGFAYAGGGGVDLKISSRFDVRPVEFLYLKTDIPNAVNNRQNQFRMSAGLIYHLTPR